jgi:hypothetical protein
MTDDMEGEQDGVPFGLLMYGQAGIYNAVDDRLVIAALSDSAIGIVRSPSLTPGSGLDVAVGAGWLAVADCGDGTRAVVGSRQTHTLTETAGPPTGQRIDHVWADTLPDDGRWELRLVPEGQTIGRAGVSLGRITVPAGANLASQFTFSRLVPTIGRHADATETPEGGLTGTGYASLTPDYPIAPTSIRPNRLFRVTCWGEGRMGASPQNLRFRIQNPVNSPVVTVNPNNGGPANLGGQWIAPREMFDFEAEVQLQVRRGGDRFRSKVKVTVTRWSNQADKQQGTTSPNRSVTAVRTNWGETANLNVAWHNIQVRFSWAGLSAGQMIRSMGSCYDTFEPYW